MTNPESDVGPLTIEQALEIAKTPFGPLYVLMEREPVKCGLAFRMLAKEVRRLRGLIAQVRAMRAKCAQAFCEAEASVIVFWPGKVPAPVYCFAHALQAKETLATMGCPVATRAVESTIVKEPQP